MKIALSEISSFLLENEMMIYIVLFDREAFGIGGRLFPDIKEFIDDHYSEERFDRTSFRRRPSTPPEPNLPLSPEIDRQSEPTVVCNSIEEDTFVPCQQKYTACPVCNKKLKGDPAYSPLCGKPLKKPFSIEEEPSCKSIEMAVCAPAPSMAPTVSQSLPKSLKELTDNLDESFSQMLLRKIDENGITDVECYKKANIDRKLFSKIRGDTHYKPKKITAIAFAVALELDIDETKSLLEKAGYALSHSNKFDIIIEYFITNQNYNIFEINEALFAFDQVLLGA